MLYTNKHIFISGQTQSGKTYFAIKLIADYNGGAIFINSQKVDVRGDFITMDKDSSELEIIKALREGKKINYLVSENLTIARREVDALINLITSAGFSKRVIFAIDEIVDYAPLNASEDDTKSLYLARRGLGRGVQAVFIAQTPADASKTITKQCQIHIFFLYNFYDEKYFERFKIETGDIKLALQNNPLYSFVILDSKGWSIYESIK